MSMMFQFASNNEELTDRRLIFSGEDGKVFWRKPFTQLMIWEGRWIDLDPLPLLLFAGPQDKLGTEITFV